VKTTIDALQDDLLPTELKAKTSAERERKWPGWVTNRDRTICARAAQGDEDSIFNLLLFGAAFTKEPRVPDVLDSVRNARTAEVVRQRLDDMVAGLVSPRGNERLQLVREVVERNASSQRRQQADARRDSTYTDSRDGDKMIWYQRSINRR